MGNIYDIIENKFIFVFVIMLIFSFLARGVIILTYKMTEKDKTSKKEKGVNVINKLLDFWGLNQVKVSLSNKSSKVNFSMHENIILISPNVNESSSFWALAMVCKECARAYHFNKNTLFYIIRETTYSILTRSVYFGVLGLIGFLVWRIYWMLFIGLGLFMLLVVFNYFMIIYDFVFTKKIIEALLKFNIITDKEMNTMQWVLFSQNLVPVCVAFDAPIIIFRKLKTLVLSKFKTVVY